MRRSGPGGLLSLVRGQVRKPVWMIMASGDGNSGGSNRVVPPVSVAAAGPATLLPPLETSVAGRVFTAKRSRQ